MLDADHAAIGGDESDGTAGKFVAVAAEGGGACAESVVQIQADAVSTGGNRHAVDWQAECRRAGVAVIDAAAFKRLAMAAAGQRNGFAGGITEKTGVCAVRYI